MTAISVNDTPGFRISRSQFLCRTALEVRGATNFLDGRRMTGLALCETEKPRTPAIGWSRAYEIRSKAIFSKEAAMGIDFQENLVQATTFYRGPANVDLTVKNNRFQVETVLDIVKKQDVEQSFDALKDRGIVPTEASFDELLQILTVIARSNLEHQNSKNSLTDLPAWTRWLAIGADSAAVLPALHELALQYLKIAS